MRFYPVPKNELKTKASKNNNTLTIVSYIKKL